MHQDKPTHFFVVRSPYAQLILCGVKTIEFRSNATTFANKRLAIATPKEAGSAAELEEESACWTLNDENDAPTQEEINDFELRKKKAKILFYKTNGKALIIGEIRTGNVIEVNGETGVEILSYTLWNQKDWIDSPGGLGLHTMPS